MSATAALFVAVVRFISDIYYYYYHCNEIL